MSKNRKEQVEETCAFIAQHKNLQKCFLIHKGILVGQAVRLCACLLIACKFPQRMYVDLMAFHYERTQAEIS